MRAQPFRALDHQRARIGRHLERDALARAQVGDRRLLIADQDVIGPFLPDECARADHGDLGRECGRGEQREPGEQETHHCSAVFGIQKTKTFAITIVAARK